MDVPAKVVSLGLPFSLCRQLARSGLREWLTKEPSCKGEQLSLVCAAWNLELLQVVGVFLFETS